MNKMETLLDSLQHQQAKIEDQEAFADMVMGRIEEVERKHTPRLTAYPSKEGTASAANNSQFSILNSQFSKDSQFSIFNFQFIVRIAASVALVLLVGFFFMLRTQTVSPITMQASNLHGMDKYRIDLSHIPTDGTAREMYRCYQEAKREQTFYHNELIKYTHENM